jgi:CheY-like chemotaxis protein
MEPRHPLILVIDDSEEIRELFRVALEQAGYRVRVAADGCQGLAAVHERRPDLIITDVSMPAMNGFQFLVKLRSDFSPPLPPVVVCSGFDVTAEEALRLGAVRFVAKPVDVASLIRMVEQALSGHAPDEAALANERTFVEAARARATAAAERLFSTLGAAQTAALDRILPRFAQRVSDYFGFSPAGIVFVENGAVRVAATSRGAPIPAGTRASGRVLFSTGVLAAGSSLVVTDAASFLAADSDSPMRTLGVEFVVAVPLVYDEVPIGAIGLVDRVPHAFEAEDLLILEGIGRGASHALRSSSPIDSVFGFVEPALFDDMLGAELSLLHRKRGGLELLLVEMAPAAIHGELALELAGRGGPRCAVCSREAGALAILKRDADAGNARRAISAVLATLRATGTVRATGWVSVVDAGLPSVPRETVLRLASVALDQSRSSDSGRIERMSIVSETVAEAASPS